MFSAFLNSPCAFFFWVLNSFNAFSYWTLPDFNCFFAFSICTFPFCIFLFVFDFWDSSSNLPCSNSVFDLSILDCASSISFSAFALLSSYFCLDSFNLSCASDTTSSYLAFILSSVILSISCTTESINSWYSSLYVSKALAPFTVK